MATTVTAPISCLSPSPDSLFPPLLISCSPFSLSVSLPWCSVGFALAIYDLLLPSLQSDSPLKRVFPSGLFKWWRILQGFCFLNWIDWWGNLYGTRLFVISTTLRGNLQNVFIIFYVISMQCMNIVSFLTFVFRCLYCVLQFSLFLTFNAISFADIFVTKRLQWGKIFYVSTSKRIMLTLKSHISSTDFFEIVFICLVKSKT